MGARCMICGLDPAKNPGAVYRVNDKGKLGVWACERHYRDARAYFPDDNPNTPASARPTAVEDEPEMGPWTGGVHWP